MYLACQYTEHPLLQVHDGVVLPLVAVHRPVIMETNNDVSAEFSTFFEEGYMTDMKQVECSGYIHHYIIRLRGEGGRKGGERREEGGREGGRERRERREEGGREGERERGGREKVLKHMQCLYYIQWLMYLSLAEVALLKLQYLLRSCKETLP